MHEKLSIAVLVLLGFGFLGWGGHVLYMAQQTTLWPTANGTVIASGVDQYVDSEDQQIMYTAKVRYQYTVGDRILTGTRIRLMDHSSSSLAEMQGIADRYQPGQDIAVHYDPDSPRTALLQSGIQTVMWIPLIFGVACVLFAAGWRVRHEGRRAQV